MVIEVTFAIILLIPQIFQLLGCDELGRTHPATLWSWKIFRFDFPKEVMVILGHLKIYYLISSCTYGTVKKYRVI